MRHDRCAPSGPTAGPRRGRAAWALAFAVTLWSGCGGGASPTAELQAGRPLAAARIAVSSATPGAPTIAAITVTISKGLGPDFPPIQVSLTRAAAGWTGFASGIPPGSARRFDLVALDPLGLPLLVASASTDVGGSGVALVSIVLQPASPPPPTAAWTPVLDLLTASTTTVSPAAPVRLGATAHDPSGDPVSYRWSASCDGDPGCGSAAGCGTFDEPAAAAVTWTAPAVPGRCELSVSMLGSAGSVAAAVGVDVSPSAL